MQNIAPSQMADTELFNFHELTIDRSGERPPYEFDNNQSIFSGNIPELEMTGLVANQDMGEERERIQVVNFDPRM